MGKVSEYFNPQAYEGTPKTKKQAKTSEKARDYWNYYPGTKSIRPFLNEREYEEVCEKEEEE